MKSKLTPQLEDRAIKLARRGYSNQAICASVGIVEKTLYSKPYSNLLQAIREEREAVRERVFNSLLEDETTQSQTFLANKLGVFRPKYKTAKPKNIKEAVDRIADIYHAVAAGEIEQDHGKYLAGFLETFIKAKEVGDLEERLEAIEEAVNEKSN